jgi:hypothetical protein
VRFGSMTRRAASVPGTGRMRTAAQGERSASGLARTLTRPVPGRARAVTVTGTRSRWAQRSSDDREIPSCRQNSPDVPVQPRNRTSRSRHSARHSALNRLAMVALLNRHPGPRPENRSAYAGGQERCRLALTDA